MKKLKIFLLSLLIFILIVFSIFSILYKLSISKNPSIKDSEINKHIKGPIDIVYTWVNGGDPNWIDLKNKYYNKMHKDGNNDTRFNTELGNKELILSIRSVFKFASWVNHIYIVTMRPQVPKIPNEYKNRITIVHHDELWEDRNVLPVFNSHAIESQLYRIKNLSEKFIYMNDDIYFMDYVYPHYYFSGEKPIYRGTSIPYKFIGMFIPKNNRKYIDAIYKIGKIFNPENIFLFRYKHFALPLLKSNMYLSSKSKELKERWALTSRSKFRSGEDIPPIHSTVLWSLKYKKAYILKKNNSNWSGLFICNISGPFFGMCDTDRIPNNLIRKLPNEICVNEPELFNKFEKLMNMQILY